MQENVRLIRNWYLTAKEVLMGISTWCPLMIRLWCIEAIPLIPSTKPNTHKLSQSSCSRVCAPRASLEHLLCLPEPSSLQPTKAMPAATSLGCIIGLLFLQALFRALLVVPQTSCNRGTQKNDRDHEKPQQRSAMPCLGGDDFGFVARHDRLLGDGVDCVDVRYHFAVV